MTETKECKSIAAINKTNPARNEPIAINARIGEKLPNSANS